jgi:23S rRNA G2445 N2-methylase RlmL
LRKAEYASIGLRQDVPETAAKDDSRLAEDIRIDGEVAFAAGPIKQSSPVFKIAVPMEDMEAEEQEELLSQVTQLLAEEFVEVNKTIMLDEPEE